MPNRRVAIVGASTSDCGRVDDKTAFELNFQGTTRALADAGIDRSPRSTGSCRSPARCRRWSWPSTSASGPTGWTRPGTAAASGSAWSSTPRPPSPRAWSRSSSSPTAPRSGPTSRRSCAWRTSPSGHAGPMQFAAPFGHPVGSHYAMVARRHMHEFGTTIEQLAEVAVSTRYNAGLNPDAFYRDPITIDDVVDAPPVWDPLTQAPLLYPDRRWRRHRADPRGAGAGLRQGAHLGARHRARPPPTRR